MRNKIILWTFVAIFYNGAIKSQILPNRYVESIFTNYTETNDVQFSTNVPQPKPGGGFYEWITGLPLNAKEYEFDDINLYMDIFEPTGDTIAKRPLVIICFGGGFLDGSKDYWSIREIAMQLAKRGYVTASIDYRLGMNVFDSELSKRAPYRALQDGRSAIRFFKADAAGSNTYKIDTSNIYIGGHSAGAFIALHNAYLDLESERPASTYVWLQDGNTCPDLGCLDCVGDNLSYSGQAAAVFSLAGALGSVGYVGTADDVPSVMFHSEDDDTVPYNSGQPFSYISWAIIGFELPDVYGSAEIADQGDLVGLEYQFNSYTDRGHAVHEETSSTLYPDIIPKISDSFYYEFLKPVTHPIFGKADVCLDDLTQEYNTLDDSAMYYDWSISGGVINNLDIMSHSVNVTWDSQATVHQLKLTPYSCQAARGDETILEIALHTHNTNTWISGNGNWEDDSNWSLGHSPLPCEDVVFPNQSGNIIVSMSDGTSDVVRSVFVGQNVQFNLLENANLYIATGGNLEVKGIINIYGRIEISGLGSNLIENLINDGIINVLSNGLIMSSM
ncbi:MAG: alpha/beta hydrolase [Saprospiraceae bacterium]